jgi:hypothetical protein
VCSTLMDLLQSPVLDVLAHHLGRPAATIHSWQDLERDLDMSPLEVALMAVEIERMEAVELDVKGLPEARTVGDLVTLFAREVDRARDARVELVVA